MFVTLSPMSTLFSPITIKNTTLKNRIVVSPMCQYSSTDGFANDWHLVHLGSRAVGGAALLIQEATAVSPEGRITYADMGLWKNEQMEKCHRLFLLYMNKARWQAFNWRMPAERQAISGHGMAESRFRQVTQWLAGSFCQRRSFCRRHRGADFAG